MKITIYGAGAIGGHLGALLSRDGVDVSLIARGGHLQAIRRDGLTLQRGDEEPFTVHPHATDDPSTLGPQDYVIVSLKSHQAPGVVDAMQPLLGPDTTVATAMNSASQQAGSHAKSAEMFGKAKVVLSKPGYYKLNAVVREGEHFYLLGQSFQIEVVDVNNHFTLVQNMRKELILAQSLQVLVVTHSPQVAARAQHHWRVAKASARGVTATGVEILDAGARREEIARMLSGAKITDAARAAADSLLADGAGKKPPAPKSTTRKRA